MHPPNKPCSTSIGTTGETNSNRLSSTSVLTNVCHPLGKKRTKEEKKQHDPNVSATLAELVADSMVGVRDGCFITDTR